VELEGQPEAKKDAENEKEITVQKWPMKVLIFDVERKGETVGQEQTTDFS